MAYTPINWQTGDTITADKLNKMDNGWRYESTQLFNETVTTAAQNGLYAAQLAYSGTIDADTIIVTFDGTEYVCPRIGDGNNRYLYGGFTEQGPVFTEYPFAIMCRDAASMVFTEAASTHTIAAATSILQTSSDFDKARGYGYVTGSPTELFSETVTTVDTGYGTYEGELTYSQLIDAGIITVTYDGIEYTCPSISAGEYGSPYNGSNPPDFSEFPFNLYTNSDGAAYLITQTAGEHTIAVTATVTVIQTSADFAKAVAGAAQPIVDDAIESLPLRCISGQTLYSAMSQAQTAGRLMYFQHELKTYFVHNVSQNISGSNKRAEFFPENSGLSVSFVNDVFIVATASH